MGRFLCNRNDAVIEELKSKIDILLQQNSDLKAKIDAIEHPGETPDMNGTQSLQEPTPVHGKPVLTDENSTTDEVHSSIVPTQETVAEECKPASKEHPVTTEAPATPTTESIPSPVNSMPSTEESNGQDHKYEKPIPQAIPQEVTELLKKVDTHLAETAYKDNIIKDIHEELQQYKNGLRQEFVKPVIKDIIHLYDTVKEALDNNPQSASNDPAFTKLYNDTKNTLYAIEDLLFAYDIEPVVVEAGTPFDPKTQKALKKEQPPTAEQNKTIVRVLKTGFKNTATGHMMRDVNVVVYSN